MCDINRARLSFGALHLTSDLEEENCDKSIRIIESHSAPDILTTATIYVKSRGTEMAESPNTKDKQEINTPKLESKEEIINKLKTPNAFKTPLHTKSYSSLPKKKNLYQNVASPIASYIHDSPSVPLIQNVRPALIGIKKNLDFDQKENKPCKENCNTKKNYATLPMVAYRTAKETHVINFPSKYKLPKSQWAKQVMSAIPKPVVVKHCYRLKDSNKPSQLQCLDDSVKELSWNQADLSICTQRSAVKKS